MSVSITCPCMECKHNGRGHKCKADKINLKFKNMATVNEGRVDMWICDRYELSEEAQKLDMNFREYLDSLRR